MREVYKSRFDMWLKILLVLINVVIFISFICAIIVFYVSAGKLMAKMSILLLAFLPMFLVVFLTYSTTRLRYILTDDALLVKSGLPFYNPRFEYAKIRNVVKSSNPLSAPAALLRHIRIDTLDGRAILISPKNSEAFIAKLLSLGDKALVDAKPKH